MMGDDLFQVRAEVGNALFALGALARDLGATEAVPKTLSDLGSSLREPFLFVVVGEVKAGKSSLLNALFGREFCRTDVLPATDKIYIFKYGETERDIAVNAQLVECYRNAPVLRDFNIVDTPGTNSIVAEHETITREFLPMADLCLVTFSIANPWGASAWQFLQHIHRKWLKKVVVVVQQVDMRSAEEVATIVQHVEQTMMQKVGERCPIFPVSARQALAAKATMEGEEKARLWEASGFGALEGFITQNVTGGETLREKLRSVCRSGQVVLIELADQVRASAQTLARDGERLSQLRATLAERKAQSIRQISGVVWTLSQSYEREQGRAEEILKEQLSLANTWKLIFNKEGWQTALQAELEAKQRQAIHKQVEDALELLQSDLRSVWKQVHGMLQREFTDGQSDGATLPDLDRQRRETLGRVELALVEKSDGAEFQAQMQRLFRETAEWLRLPAAVLAAGGVATVVAAALAKLTVLDVTGAIAGIGAVTGTVYALVRRRKILGEFRRQMQERRELTLQAIEDHLRHGLNCFYLEMEGHFQPLEAFCNGQRQRLEPQLTRIRELEATLGRCASSLGG